MAGGSYSYLLYGLIIGAALGMLLANPVIQFPSYTGLYHANLGFLFPILFITIACGAVSGFHSLVASGTTSKQLNNEKDGKFIAYGSMLLEALLAVIAISSVAYLTQAQFSARWEELGGPIGIFAAGVGYFISHLGISEASAIAFTALVASAFLLTSLDSITRLGRYVVQELTEKRIPEI